MTSPDLAGKGVQVSAENVGGIGRTEVEFSPGVTALSGRNATNRTSFLRAVMAALGSDDVSLKGNADVGRVEMTIGDETYTRTLRRENGTVVLDGDPYLDESEVADLFAFLLETNEARQAVERGDDLRELVMRPVDTAAIQDEITSLRDEKDRIDDRLDELDALEAELPGLERRKTELETRIDETREALEEKRAEIDAADDDIDETREEEAELESALETLQTVRSDLESTRYDIETEQESLKSLRAEEAELEEELEELTGETDHDVDAIRAEIDGLEDRKQSLNSTITTLQNIIQFTRDLTDDDYPSPLATDGGAGEGAVTDRLIGDGESVACWTCGSEVEKSQITNTVGKLEDLREERLEERRSVTGELDDLRTRLKEAEETKRRHENVREKLDRVRSEIDDREASVEDLRAEREDLEAEIQELEDEVAELESAKSDELLEAHRELNQIEFDLDSLREDRESVEREIEEIEDSLEERSQLEDQREEVTDALEDLRTRVDRIEENAVEEFNTHMENVLDILDYANIDRIWIERTRREVTEGRRTVTRSSFDLHIIRRTDDGTSYEDRIDHLSESEREVTGLVFALAGYLVHDVYDTVPFILLDSLESMDSGRIAALIEYFEEYADYVVAALLPEDAAALDDDHERIVSI